MPSIDGLREIPQAVREKYSIPEVLPENVQLAETLFQERILEEWLAIGDEIEAKLRENFPIPDFGIMKIYGAFKESASKSPELEQLMTPLQLLDFQKLQKIRSHFDGVFKYLMGKELLFDAFA